MKKLMLKIITINLLVVGSAEAQSNCGCNKYITTSSRACCFAPWQQPPTEYISDRSCFNPCQKYVYEQRSVSVPYTVCKTVPYTACYTATRDVVSNGMQADIDTIWRNLNELRQRVDEAGIYSLRKDVDDLKRRVDTLDNSIPH